ncbi:hypothetical protein L2E82_30692 [Cichorium intybus]|uniref:Uncharacterized protein n=1 Tax=Cichorium intybus TaxID=13427 RepID=A0ACB9D180_CICIN|nr:hypothetical protein L2E82_30692 [Cichorium intybus]
MMFLDRSWLPLAKLRFLRREVEMKDIEGDILQGGSCRDPIGDRVAISCELHFAVGRYSDFVDCSWWVGSRSSRRSGRDLCKLAILSRDRDPCVSHLSRIGQQIGS